MDNVMRMVMMAMVLALFSILIACQPVEQSEERAIAGEAVKDPSRGSAGLPDLVLSQFSYFDVAQPGEDVLVVDVENKGGTSSLPPPNIEIKVRVFPPLSGLKDNHFLALEQQNNGKNYAPKEPLLAPGAVFASSGNYFIQVDFDNVVQESNEDNNCGFYDPAKNTVTPAPCRAYPQK